MTVPLGPDVGESEVTDKDEEVGVRSAMRKSQRFYVDNILSRIGSLTIG